MSLSSSLSISASGLTAERLRLDVISNNIANVNTTRAPGSGGPFRRQQVVFAAREAGGGAFAASLASARRNGPARATGAGVQVASIAPDASDFKVVHDPGHPHADKRTGNVLLPNVEPIVEMVDMIGATRAYESGITAINAAKDMEQRALEIGRQ